MQQADVNDPNGPTPFTSPRTSSYVPDTEHNITPIGGIPIPTTSSQISLQANYVEILSSGMSRAVVQSGGEDQSMKRLIPNLWHVDVVCCVRVCVCVCVYVCVCMLVRLGGLHTRTIMYKPWGREWGRTSVYTKFGASEGLIHFSIKSHHSTENFHQKCNSHISK